MIFPAASFISTFTTVSATNSLEPAIRNAFLPPVNVSGNSVILKYLLFISVSLINVVYLSKFSGNKVFLIRAICGISFQ